MIPPSPIPNEAFRSRPTRRRPVTAVLVVTAVLALGAAACGDDPDDDGATPAGDDTRTVTLVTHESFDVSPEVLEAFTAETGIEVRVLPAGDAVELVNKAILTAGDPEGDVLFGVDSNLLARALGADLFEPYEAAGLDAVDPDLLLDPSHRLTPIDRGDVCLNYDKAWFAEADLDPPDSLDDLVDPAYEGLTVVQNPATSTPGLAFLLATVAEFGDDGYGGEGWEGWWTDLRANDVAVGDGWEDTYYGSFSGGSGEGDRPIVVSYASSPPVEVLFSDPPVDVAPTGVVAASCYRQVEFAGVLRGAEHPDEARALIDFLLSEPFQADIPLKMFVYPARTDVALPDLFVQHSVVVDDPLELDADLVAAEQADWVERWTETVLR